MRAFTLLPILMLLACSQQGRSRGDDWGTVMRTMHGATVTSMPAPSQPGVHDESPGRPGSVLAATLRDIQDCTDRHGKALWRPGSKESGLPIIKKSDVVSTDPMPDNWAYRARLAVMSAWSVVSRLLYADLLCLPSAESTHPFAIICRQRNRRHVHLRNTARKDQETYCIYEDPEMSKATVTIGSNRTSVTDLVDYPPAEYVDLPNKLASVKLIGD
jgi:hypothetical protein